MQISFTSSHYNIPKIAELYHNCDIIFTTNWEALLDLKKKFGDKINLLPHGYTGVKDYIKKDTLETYKQATFIEYNDVRTIIKKLLVEGDWVTHQLLADYNGWAIQRSGDKIKWIRDNKLIGVELEGTVPTAVREYHTKY